MTYYRVALCGRGIEVASEDGPPFTGFRRTRGVQAANEQEAAEQAMNAEREDWSAGEMFERNRGAAPTLSVEGVAAVGRCGTGVWSSYRFFSDD